MFPTSNIFIPRHVCDVCSFMGTKRRQSKKKTGAILFHTLMEKFEFYQSEYCFNISQIMNVIIAMMQNDKAENIYKKKKKTCNSTFNTHIYKIRGKSGEIIKE